MVAQPSGLEDKRWSHEVSRAPGSGVQLKTLSWECSLIGPQQGVMPQVLNSLARRGEASEERSSETQALGSLLRHIPLQFTAQEANFP